MATRTIVALFAGAAALLGASPAAAGCVYGTKNLGGSLGPGQSDNSRSFTINDTARFKVQVQTGGPITANIGCGWATGRNHSCRVYGYGERFVQLANNGGRTITYRWICRH